MSDAGPATVISTVLPSNRRSRISEPAHDDEESIPRGFGTILVAEDDPFVRASVILRLEGLGYTVISAVTGNDALAKLRALCALPRISFRLPAVAGKFEPQAMRLAP